MQKNRSQRIWELLTIVGTSIHHAHAIMLYSGMALSVPSLLFAVYLKNPLLIAIFSAIFSASLGAFIAWMLTERAHKRKDKKIARAFCDLENYYVEFARIAIEIIHPKTNISNVDNSRQILSAKHGDYLRRICETAVLVMGTKKGRRAPLSANIKTLYLDPKTRDRCYRLSVTTEGKDTPRTKYDEARGKSKPRVESNYMYKRMFDDNIGRDYYICRNVYHILEDAKASSERIEEPNEEFASLAKSLIIYPIYAKPTLTVEDHNNSPSRMTVSGDEEIYFMYGNKEVYGLMCVDSQKVNAFDLEYDLDIMKQLTSYAFESFRIANIALTKLDIVKITDVN